MNSQPKILLIDKAADRKDRINALKARGYTVFPALRMEEARSRCVRGGYDLIMVNAGDDLEQAVAYCDDIRKQCPRQQIVLLGNAQRDYAIAPDLNSVLEGVDRLLNREAAPADYASAA